MMLVFGRLHRSEDGGSDLRRWIQAVVGLLLASPLLLWVERGRGEGGVVFLNNLVATCCVPPQCCYEEEALLAGRGGEEEGQIGAGRCPAASLMAGLGGEGGGDEARCTGFGSGR
jgi:hypothetical protein